MTKLILYFPFLNTLEHLAYQTLELCMCTLVHVCNIELISHYTLSSYSLWHCTMRVMPCKKQKIQEFMKSDVIIKTIACYYTHMYHQNIIFNKELLIK